MKLTRRDMLIAGLTVPFVVGPGRRLLAATVAATLPSPLMVAITGVDLETTAHRISALFQPLLDQKIPVTIGVSATSGSGSRLDPTSSLAQTLRTTLDAYPDLFEIALDAGAFDSDDPYFQLRQASEGQAALTWSLNPVGDFHRETLFTAQTLTTSTQSLALDHLAGLRAAGIRTVIHLPPSDTTGAPVAAGFWTTPTGLAKTFALASTSVRLPGPGAAPAAVEALRAGLTTETAAHNPIVVHLPLAAFDSMAESDMSAYAGALAQMLQDMNGAGTARLMLPYPLYRQTITGPAQYVIVRVDDLRVARGNEESHRAFTMDLLTAGIPVSEAIIPHGYGPGILQPLTDDTEARLYLEGALFDPNYDVVTHGLVHVQNELVGGTLDQDLAIVTEGMREIYQTVKRVPTAYIPPDDAFDDNALAAIADCGNRIFAAEQGSYQWIWGMRKNGLLHMSNSIKFEKAWTDDVPYYDTAEIMRAFGTRNDAVFMIHPATASTPQKRQQIMDVLSGLSAQSGTKLVNFTQYAAAVTTPMPTADLMQSARAQRRIIDPTVAVAPTLDSDLKTDAATAWGYFDGMATTNKGLVYGTAWLVDGKLDGYAFGTMWDFGSLLLAYCSAYKLGLIDQTRFETLSRDVLDFLGQSFFRTRGALLPDAERPIGKASGQRKGFDAIDTGRLLVALKRLDDLTAQSLPVQALVKQWNLEAALTDGEMHNFSPDGTSTSVHFTSSYALYAARGFKLWGFDLKPVFATQHPAADMDSTLAFLAEIGARTAIATEPWTTEHIEMTPSEHTVIIEDLLYMAQMRRRASTGFLTSVSEVAIDRDPWFVYQGYQFGAGGETWRVDAQNDDAKYKSPDFIAANRIISTKGAFLWLATRPGAYATDLYRLVRDNCRTDSFGFSSGVYEQSNTASRLSDVNTNGVILEAIDYMLNGGNALLS